MKSKIKKRFEYIVTYLLPVLIVAVSLAYAAIRYDNAFDKINSMEKELHEIEKVLAGIQVTSARLEGRILQMNEYQKKMKISRINVIAIMRWIIAILMVVKIYNYSTAASEFLSVKQEFLAFRNCQRVTGDYQRIAFSPKYFSIPALTVSNLINVFETSRVYIIH